MNLFEAPPPTRYDLSFTLAKIPIRVHPLFWVMTLLLGISAGNPLQLLIWIPAVFVSILIHELGHALAMRLAHQPSRIVLHAAGGLTVPEPVFWGSRFGNRWAYVALSPAQRVLISLAGPAAGFLLAGLLLAAVALAGGSVAVSLLFGVIPFPVAALPAGGWLVNLILATLLWVNVFWGYINLAPVFPLDGGSIARTVLLAADPRRGERRSLWVSLVAGVLVALAGLILLRSIYVALLFGLLAFQSYMALRTASTW